MECRDHAASGAPRPNHRAHQSRLSGLKLRTKVVAGGKLVTSARAAWALCAGADFVNTARGFMFALGCIQALRCHTNHCPTGITTHNRRLQRGRRVRGDRELDVVPLTPAKRKEASWHGL